MLTVADFGAGNERLRPMLADRLDAPHHYMPYDLYPQLQTTTRLDVLQELPARSFDLGFCLGLLEYCHGLPAFLAGLHTHCRFVVASYVPATGLVSTHSDREHRGWTTHLTRQELESEFQATGFSLVGTTICDGGATCLWLWQSSGNAVPES